MKTLYLLCGVSFLGKSTLARALRASRSLGYISLDDINHERGLGFGGDGIPVEEWERTHAVARERLATLAASGQDVLLDDTCSTSPRCASRRGMSPPPGSRRTWTTD